MSAVCEHPECIFWTDAERCETGRYCPECMCEYHAKNTQWWCLDGGCDCHYVAADSGEAER
jgi:hypothetical protein